jgi:hypothetical protein
VSVGRDTERLADIERMERWLEEFPPFNKTFAGLLDRLRDANKENVRLTAGVRTLGERHRKELLRADAAEARLRDAKALAHVRGSMVNALELENENFEAALAQAKEAISSCDGSCGSVWVALSEAEPQ